VTQLDPTLHEPASWVYPIQVWDEIMYANHGSLTNRCEGGKTRCLHRHDSGPSYAGSQM